MHDWVRDGRRGRGDGACDRQSPVDKRARPQRSEQDFSPSLSSALVFARRRRERIQSQKQKVGWKTTWERLEHEQHPPPPPSSSSTIARATVDSTATNPSLSYHHLLVPFCIPAGLLRSWTRARSDLLPAIKSTQEAGSSSVASPRTPSFLFLDCEVPQQLLQKTSYPPREKLLPSVALDASSRPAAIVDLHLVPGAGRRNYTGFITKTIVYSATLILVLVAFALTLASILVPRWVTYLGETPSGVQYHYSYGLHRRCSSLSGACDPFPGRDDCQPDERYFCSMWRSIGFLMSFAVMLEAMTVTAYVVVLSGGKQKRETGWHMLTLFLVLVTVVQAAAMALVCYLYDHNERFHAGWTLDSSFIMCTLSMCLSLLTAIVIGWSVHFLPSEGGYELIADSYHF